MPSVSDQVLVEQIWDEYPKKCGRKRGKNAIEKALTRHTAAIILGGVREMAAALKELGIDRHHDLWRFVKYPEGYFNGEMYLDDVRDFTWYQQPKTPGSIAEQGKYDGIV